MDLVARLAEDPARAAILLDVDGTLAPIVPRPEDAHVPAATQKELRRLHNRYALVACVSGRAGAEARRIVGVPELLYVGNHGLELEPESAAWRERLARLLAEVDWAKTEDKGLSASFHYRDSPDEDAARTLLEAVAARAREAGFVARWGRKVLEVLPPLEANKGTAIRRLLASRRLQRALYAGDDTTDLDGFRALDGLELAVRVAVTSAEMPPQLAAEADLSVDTPAALVEILSQL